jgi:hypothetical protein
MDDRLKPLVESADEVLRKSPSRRCIAFCLVVHLVSEDPSKSQVMVLNSEQPLCWTFLMYDS